jgi:hypothetical protein
MPDRQPPSAGAYRIQTHEQSCCVLDADDLVVFAGTFRECEEWLDAAENRRLAAARSTEQATERRPAWFRWIARLWCRNEMRRDERQEIASVALQPASKPASETATTGPTPVESKSK